MNGSGRGLGTWTIAGLVVALLVVVVAITHLSQLRLERQLEDRWASQLDSLSLAEGQSFLEVTKLDAEIRKLRSDTLGSLFWLKLIGVIVTVGGAVGGYLVGQGRITAERINFETRKNVDAVYQAIVKELADESPVLRAAAAVKLGSILQEFPDEWRVSDNRKRQIVQLTKQVLAAALSIETDGKVLKTISINVVLHKEEGDERARAQGLDLSAARAPDAYWARTDFTYADFYLADLHRTSFRKSLLTGAQFREATLTHTVFAGAICTQANFKMADLRWADFTAADLTGATFDRTKVFGARLPAEVVPAEGDFVVDVSEKGNGSKMVPVAEWLGSPRVP